MKEINIYNEEVPKEINPETYGYNRADRVKLIQKIEKKYKLDFNFPNEDALVTVIHTEEEKKDDVENIYQDLKKLKDLLGAEISAINNDPNLPKTTLDHIQPIYNLLDKVLAKFSEPGNSGWY